jgi:DNA-binding NarL/FixJ family response regulator
MSTIYLLDDHSLLREGLCCLLQAAGYRVVGHAADAAQALQEIVQLQPDVLLLDLMLNRTSGLVVLIELQRRSSLPTRSIVLTMSAQPRHVRESLRSGAQGYVLKAATSIELRHAIDVVLKGGRYLSAQVAGFDPHREPRASHSAPAQDDTDPWEALSMRERQILEMVVRGHSSAAIAQAVHLSPKTIETYRSRMMAKLGVRNVTELVRHAVRHGLIDADAT